MNKSARALYERRAREPPLHRRGSNVQGDRSFTILTTETKISYSIAEDLNYEKLGDCYSAERLIEYLLSQIHTILSVS